MQVEGLLWPAALRWREAKTGVVVRPELCDCRVL